jgi:predicted flap endonuclease-1-like 5' DNA nuclease
MHSTNLEKISLDEFQEILLSIELLPSRKILLEGLSTLIERLKQKGIDHLEALQKLLKNKKAYPEMAEELAVSVEYLTVLNREINSYVSKPVPLSKLEVFSDAELDRLEGAGLKSTRDLYERGLTRSERGAMAEELSIPLDKIIAALELSDLLRITGVGPVYARILREMDINNAKALLEIDSQEAVDTYTRVNAEKNYSKVNLGIKDIEYVKRFCQKLDSDIQW